MLDIADAPGRDAGTLTGGYHGGSRGFLRVGHSGRRDLAA